MTLKADLEELPELAETSKTLSWRAWLLLPLALIGLTGIVVPLTGRSADKDTSFQIDLSDEEEDLVPYYGELQRILDRAEIAANHLSVIQGLHDRLTDFAGRNGGRIRATDRDKVDRFLREFRYTAGAIEAVTFHACEAQMFDGGRSRLHATEFHRARAHTRTMSW